MADNDQIPEGYVLARTTDELDNESVPAGLLKAHRVAAGVWGRLVVRDGSVGFVFEDEPDEVIMVAAGGAVVIPPMRQHHVELGEPARFVVEFYREPKEPSSTEEHRAEGSRFESTGLESTGLEP